MHKVIISNRPTTLAITKTSTILPPTLNFYWFKAKHPCEKTETLAGRGAPMSSYTPEIYRLEINLCHSWPVYLLPSHRVGYEQIESG